MLVGRGHRSSTKLQTLAANICKSPPGEQLLWIIQLNPSRLKCVMKDGGEEAGEERNHQCLFPFSLFRLAAPVVLIPGALGGGGLVPQVKPGAAPSLPLLPPKQI